MRCLNQSLKIFKDPSCSLVRVSLHIKQIVNYIKILHALLYAMLHMLHSVYNFVHCITHEFGTDGLSSWGGGGGGGSN